MRKISAFLILAIGPLFPVPAGAFTPVGGTAPNAYMVENTTGTSPAGAACYEFQTNPTCSATITNLTTTISSAAIPGGSTQYIQNTGTPTTATQVFSVSSATINGQLTQNGAEIITYNNGLQFQTSSGANGALISNPVGSGIGGLTINAPGGLGVGLQNNFTSGTPVLLVSSTTSPFYGSFAVQGSSNDASATYSGFIGTSAVNANTLWSLPKKDGTNGQSLVTDGAAHLSFTTVPVQSTQCVVTVTSQTTTNVYALTNLSCTITPSSSAKRVRISVSGQMLMAAVLSVNMYATLFRGTTNLATGSGPAFAHTRNEAAATLQVPASMVFIDSPATASPVTYSVRIKNDDGSTAVSWGSDVDQVMILDEVP